MGEFQLPFLQEHQASDNPNATGSPTYNPSPDDRKTIQLVEKLYSRAKKYRKQYEQKWLDYYKTFRGRQWKEIRPSYRHSEVINLVFQTIQSMVPTLTDSRPKLEFLPTIPEQFELADILTKVAENDWTHNNWLQILTEILYDSHFYGLGFGTIGFDEKANLGLGNIFFESADPFYIFPDPNARDVNDKRCKFLIYAEPTDISEIKKQYPDLAPYFTPDVIDLANGNKTDLDQVMFKSPVESRLIIEGTSMYETAGRDQVLKLTAFFLDDSFEEEEQLIEESEGKTPNNRDLDKTPSSPDTPQDSFDGSKKTKTVRKLKYPQGRKIVIAGGVLCEQSPFDTPDRKIPFIRLINYLLPREFWGISEIEQLEGPQKTFNKLVSFALDVMTLMGNPIWVVGSQANIDTDNLFNKPGLVVETDDITQVKREPGVELQPFVMQLAQQYRQWFDGISGQTDLSRGVEPNDVTAASAIADLQEAQQTRLRLKSRNIDTFLNQFGKMYLAWVFEKYSLPRIMRVTGDDGAEQYFQFHVESIDKEDGTKGYVAHVGNFDPETRKMMDIKKYEITADFDVRVSTGSSLPFAKEAKSNMAFQLFKLGVIDDEELLKDLDYPNYEAVLQRVYQKKAQMAQAQAQAQGGGPPPPGGPPQGPPPAPPPAPPQAA